MSLYHSPSSDLVSFTVAVSLRPGQRSPMKVCLESFQMYRHHGHAVVFLSGLGSRVLRWRGLGLSLVRSYREQSATLREWGGELETVPLNVS